MAAPIHLVVSAMPSFHATQSAAVTHERFFQRVRDFVHAQSPSPALRDAALDRPLTVSAWSPYWPALRDASEHDAALFMCFLLACAMLRIDVGRAAAAVGQSTQPALSMRLFLSERGLLRFSAFELPHLGKPGPAS